MPHTCMVGWAVWFSDGQWARYANEQDARSSVKYWRGASKIYLNGQEVA